MNVKKLFLLLAFAMPLTLKAQQDSVPEVEKLLSLSLEQLLDIKVVSASGFLQTATEAPSTIQVVTSRQIAERGYEQLEDVFRDIPGIDMIHINGYAPTLFYFRGMYGAENLRALLMIDGVVENNIIGSNDMAGPAYSLHNVERIEIIWGPASALYGANAFGGIINIITKKGSDINGLHAETGFGSFNTTITRMSMGAKRNNFDLAFSGSLYSTDGPSFRNRDPRYHGAFVDHAFSFIGNISYNGKRSKTTMSYRAFKTPMGWGTYANSPTVYFHLPPAGNGNVGVVGISQRDFNDEQGGVDAPYSGTFFIQHDRQVNKRMNIMARAVYRETGIDQDSYVYLTIDGTKMIRAKVAEWSNRLSGEVTANYSIADKHRFFAALQYSEDNVEAGSRQATFDPTPYLVNGKDTVINLGAMFLPRNYDIRKNFGSSLQYVLRTKFLHNTEFTAGIRYDNNSYFGDAVSPRVVVVNQPAERWTFKLQYGRAFRAPTNLEIHQAPPNFALTTEKIQTYEANAIYSKNKNLRMQLNFFRNEMRDVIVIANLSGFVENKNPGKINEIGVEGITDFSLSENLHGFFNASWQQAKGENLVTGAKGDVAGIAKFKANLGLTATVADLFTSTVTGNWVGKRQPQRTNPYGPVAGYFLANLSVTTKPLFKERITAGLTVHNLFNRTWYDPGFRTADGALYSTVLEQPGTTVLFKLAVHLSNNQ